MYVCWIDISSFPSVNFNFCLSVQVSVASPNSAFSIGVGEKPLDDRSTSSTQLWAFESHTGRLYHEGESNDLMFTVTEGDRLVT